jgi:hypothetical protein
MSDFDQIDEADDINSDDDSQEPYFHVETGKVSA